LQCLASSLRRSPLGAAGGQGIPDRGHRDLRPQRDRAPHQGAERGVARTRLRRRAKSRHGAAVCGGPAGAPPRSRGGARPAQRQCHRDGIEPGGRRGLSDRSRERRYNLLLTPTLCLPAFPLGVVGPSEVAGRKVTHLGWTLCHPFNYSGQPAVSVPAGWTSSGLPVGLQIVGRRLEDALVLRAAAAFEALRPWSARRPPETQG
jgi:hypothetical protein